MPTKADVMLAAQLVHRGLVSRADMESCLSGLGDRVLAELIVERGLLSAEALEQLRLEMAVSEGQLPDLFPGYRLEERLGEGGMSWVFRASRSEQAGGVAIKILKPECAAVPKTRAQFIREAKLLKGLRHTNVVEGYEVGRIRGFYFFSMEAVEGETLLAHIDRKTPFDEDAALYVVLQIARALQYLRENGIVHRDIKPGNILLTSENTVKLCDLGLASVAGSEDEGEGETTVGTVEYLSPEQAQGQELDVRSDIYSLGVTLYHLVVGRLPFEGSDDREVMAKQILESLSSPDMKSRMSPHMHYFIEKMMAKEREIRYQDPVELIGDIETQIEGKKTLTFNPASKSKTESAPAKPKDIVSTRRRSTLRRSRRR